jgi:hypothetical protein
MARILLGLLALGELAPESVLRGARGLRLPRLHQVRGDAEEGGD